VIVSYVIHLDRAGRRRANARALAARLPRAEILAAIEGRSLSPAETARHFRPHLHPPPYPFAPLPGEIGCFLSHRACWRRLVDSDAEAALIAEDDVVPDARFDAALALALRHVAPGRYIRFAQKDRESGSEIDRAGEVALLLPRTVGLGTGLQLVGRAAAERLLALSAPFDRPVDAFLQMRWLTGIEMLALCPGGWAPLDGPAGASTVQARKSLGAELARNFKRTRYRAMVRRLSKKPKPAPQG